MNHSFYMTKALDLARQAKALGEVPVGALVVFEGSIVGQGTNRREIDRDPLAHAEILALREASHNLGRWRLSGCSLYVTLEPCVMCAGALVQSRIDRLIYAAADEKYGAINTLYQIAEDPRLNHRIQVISGICAEESQELLKDFFKQLRLRGPREKHA